MDSIIYVNSNYDSMSNLEKEKNENRDFFDIESQIKKGKAASKNKSNQKEEVRHETY
ncbi:MAG: hypothetical protein NC548_45045 [Lachnospiraceae bacterium]|nr:hypothetical protein [Lachnospiraceae bacterium]